MDDWRIARRARVRASAPTSASTTVEDVQDEIARVAPAYAGVDAELLAARADGAVLPIADHPDELVFHRVGRSSPCARRGNRSRRLRRDRRRSRATSPTAATDTDGQRDRRGGRHGCARRRHAAAAAAAARAADLFQWDRPGHGPGPGAARRVQSPPRGRPHALRRRTHHCRRARRSPSLAHRRPRWWCTRATSPASGSTAEGDDVRVTSGARHAHASPCAPTPPPRPAPRSWPFAQTRRRRSATTSSTSPPSVTELRVETTR